MRANNKASDQPVMEPADGDRLDAFISYSRKDMLFARKLEAALEGYHPPRQLDVPQRRLVVFRDEQDITGPEYYEAVEGYLARSTRLIVLCSPHARGSAFVNDEIRRFVRLHSAADIVPILIAGRPNNEAGDQESEKAFPDALLDALNMPLAIDYVGFDAGRDRPDRASWTNAWYTLLANLYGLNRAEIEQRELRRRIRRRNITVAIVSTVATMLAALSVVAWFQKRAADRERLTAETRLAENFWQRNLAAREQGDELSAAHWLAQTAALNAGSSRRPGALLGIAYTLGSVRLRLVTDGFAAADLPETTSLPLPPNAMLSPDESVLVTWLPGDATLKGNAIARLWRTSTGEQIGSDLTHAYWIYGVKFIDGGRRLLTWGGTDPLPSVGQVNVWDVTSGARALPEMETEGLIKFVELSRDERRLLARTDVTAYVWSLADGKLLRPALAVQDSIIAGARLVDEGRRVLTRVYPSDRCLLWEVDAETEPVVTDCPSGPELNPSEDELEEQIRKGVPVRLSHGDRSLTVKARAVTIERQGGGPLEHRILRHEGDVHLATFNADGTAILTVSGTGVARLWDLVPDFPAPVPFSREAEFAGAASDDSHDRIYTWGRKGTGRSSDPFEVAAWELSSGRLLMTIDHDRPDESRMALGHGDGSAVLSADRSRILSWSEDGTLRLHGAADGRELTPLMRHDSGVMRAIFSPDEHRILSWDRGARVYRWDARTGAPLGSPFIVGEKGRFPEGQWNRDGSRLLLWSERTLGIWDAVSGAALVPPMAHDDSVFGARFDRREERVLSWGKDGAVRLWSATTGAALATPMIDPRQRPEPVRGAIFNADETRILSWTAFFSPWGRVAGNARLWDLTGSTVGTRLAHNAQINGAALFASDTRVLTWSEDAHSRIWDASSGALVADLRHRGAVKGARFSADRSRILTWNEPGVAQLWDAVSGIETSPPMPHPGIAGAEFGPDGQFIATWGNEALVRLWDSSDGSPIGPTLRLVAPARGLSLETSKLIQDVAFVPQSGGLVAWARVGAQFWRLNPDWSVPPKHLPLKVEAATATAIDAHGRLRFLSRQELNQRRAALALVEAENAGPRRRTTRTALMKPNGPER